MATSAYTAAVSEFPPPARTLPEADAFLAAMKGVRLPDGRDCLVRHGHGPERHMQTGIGPVTVQRVRLRDRGANGGERIGFTSAILPRWAE